MSKPIYVSSLVEKDYSANFEYNPDDYIDRTTLGKNGNPSSDYFCAEATVKVNDSRAVFQELNNPGVTENLIALEGHPRVDWLRRPIQVHEAYGPQLSSIFRGKLEALNFCASPKYLLSNAPCPVLMERIPIQTTVFENWSFKDVVFIDDNLNTIFSNTTFHDEWKTDLRVEWQLLRWKVSKSLPYRKPDLMSRFHQDPLAYTEQEIGELLRFLRFGIWDQSMLFEKLKTAAMAKTDYDGKHSANGPTIIDPKYFSDYAETFGGKTYSITTEMVKMWLDHLKKLHGVLEINKENQIYFTGKERSDPRFPDLPVNLYNTSNVNVLFTKKELSTRMAKMRALGRRILDVYVFRRRYQASVNFWMDFDKKYMTPLPVTIVGLPWTQRACFGYGVASIPIEVMNSLRRWMWDAIHRELLIRTRPLRSTLDFVASIYKSGFQNYPCNVGIARTSKTTELMIPIQYGHWYVAKFEAGVMERHYINQKVQLCGSNCCYRLEHLDCLLNLEAIKSHVSNRLQDLSYGHTCDNCLRRVKTSFEPFYNKHRWSDQQGVNVAEKTQFTRDVDIESMIINARAVWEMEKRNTYLNDMANYPHHANRSWEDLDIKTSLEVFTPLKEVLKLSKHIFGRVTTHWNPFISKENHKQICNALYTDFVVLMVITNANGMAPIAEVDQNSILHNGRQAKWLGPISILTPEVKDLGRSPTPLRYVEADYQRLHGMIPKVMNPISNWACERYTPLGIINMVDKHRTYNPRSDPPELEKYDGFYARNAHDFLKQRCLSNWLVLTPWKENYHTCKNCHKEEVRNTLADASKISVNWHGPLQYGGNTFVKLNQLKPLVLGLNPVLGDHPKYRFELRSPPCCRLETDWLSQMNSALHLTARIDGLGPIREETTYYNIVQLKTNEHWGCSWEPKQLGSLKCFQMMFCQNESTEMEEHFKTLPCVLSCFRETTIYKCVYGAIKRMEYNLLYNYNNNSYGPSFNNRQESLFESINVNHCHGHKINFIHHRFTDLPMFNYDMNFDWQFKAYMTPPVDTSHLRNTCSKGHESLECGCPINYVNPCALQETLAPELKPNQLEGPRPKEMTTEQCCIPPIEGLEITHIVKANNNMPNGGFNFKSIFGKGLANIHNPRCWSFNYLRNMDHLELQINRSVWYGTPTDQIHNHGRFGLVSTMFKGEHAGNRLDYITEPAYISHTGMTRHTMFKSGVPAAVADVDTYDYENNIIPEESQDHERTRLRGTTQWMNNTTADVIKSQFEHTGACNICHYYQTKNAKILCKLAGNHELKLELVAEVEMMNLPKPAPWLIAGNRRYNKWVKATGNTSPMNLHKVAELDAMDCVSSWRQEVNWESKFEQYFEKAKERKIQQVKAVECGFILGVVMNPIYEKEYGMTEEILSEMKGMYNQKVLPPNSLENLLKMSSQLEDLRSLLKYTINVKEKEKNTPMPNYALKKKPSKKRQKK
jgi:hypothetical protein